FANRAERFMHAYTIGLTGSQAAWASRKYRGHRTVPIMKPMNSQLPYYQRLGTGPP
ncbi:hypothetical protein B0H13DRAFT_1612869, partial [Mycena leptocephala]